MLVFCHKLSLVEFSLGLGQTPMGAVLGALCLRHRSWVPSGTGVPAGILKFPSLGVRKNMHSSAIAFDVYDTAGVFFKVLLMTLKHLNVTGLFVKRRL